MTARRCTTLGQAMAGHCLVCSRFARAYAGLTSRHGELTNHRRFLSGVVVASLYREESDTESFKFRIVVRCSIVHRRAPQGADGFVVGAVVQRVRVHAPNNTRNSTLPSIEHLIEIAESFCRYSWPPNPKITKNSKPYKSSPFPNANHHFTA